MINTSNTYTVSVYNENYEYDDIHNDNNAIKDNIRFLNNCENKIRKIDNILDDTNNINISVLIMIANQQKQVVLEMLGQNPEQVISSILAGSIEIYAQQLQKIYGWTQGGIEMFRSSLMLMFEKIKANGVEPENLEDLFQLALLEIMANAKEYGLENWYNTNKGHISHILESTGSGSHSIHESDYNSPEKMAKWVSQLYESLKKEGNIPKESFLGQIMAELDKKGGSKALSDQIINGWNDDYGWWVQSGENKNDPLQNRASTISPMLKLFILSSLLEEKKMNKEQVELILTGSLEDIDKLIADEFDFELKKYESASLTWLEGSSKWRIIDRGDKGFHIDWYGTGITIADLDKLYNEFPGRELSEDEIEEMNRIGDQVKMIQQTLKYWIQLCTDEQIAMARNL